MLTVAVWPCTGQEENELDYVLSNFNPEAIWLLGDYQCTNNLMRDAPRAKTFADLPSDPLVLFAPTTSRNFTPTVSLTEFTHPENAVYVFGPNNLHLADEDLGGRTLDHVVNIPTDTHDEMYAHTAIAVALWSRRYG